MVDIKQIFEDSFNLLNKQRKLVIPLFLATAIPLALVFLFVQFSGLSPILKDMAEVQADFDEQKADYLLDKDNIKDKNYTLEIISYLGKDNQRSPYYDQYLDYLIESGFDFTRFVPLWNTNNIIVGIIFILAAIIASIYFSVMSYAKISLEVLKKKETKSSLNRFIWKFILFDIASLFIFIAPLALFIFLIFAGVALSEKIIPSSEITAILGVFAALLLYLGYAIFIGVRLLFALPILFIEEKGVLQSLKQSFTSTKGHFKQVFFIGFVILGIGIFINSFVAQPLYDIFYNFIFGPNFLKISANFIFLLLFLALESIVMTFQRIFLFNSYLDYKANLKNRQGGK